MEKQMRFVSTFTGVGMFDLGLMRAGMECIHQVEIDEHCQAVLRHRFPNVPKSKDIYEVAKSAGTIAGSTFDLLVGGSPCQSFSVAGRRQGLEGESQLWYEYHRLLEEYRPTWFIWENVPGVLSSGPTNDAGDKLAGYDFSVILSGFTGSYQRIPKKGWRNSGVANGPFYNVAWRILDARYFGVAQRRRRVFVVGRLAAAGGSPAEILFERESAGWDLQPSRATRKNAAAAAGGTAGRGRAGSGAEVDENVRAAHSLSPYDVAPTLAASGAGTARPSISNAGHEFLAISAFQAAGFGEYSEADVAGTLRTAEGGGGTRLQNLVATAFRMRAFGDYVEEDVAPTLRSGQGGEGVGVISRMFGIRRFTPIETERLQGLPDDWTRWRDDGKEQSDAQRYAQCGNGGAVPILHWLGNRIMAYEED